MTINAKRLWLQSIKTNSVSYLYENLQSCTLTTMASATSALVVVALICLSNQVPYVFIKTWTAVKMITHKDSIEYVFITLSHLSWIAQISSFTSAYFRCLNKSGIRDERSSIWFARTMNIIQRYDWKDLQQN